MKLNLFISTIVFCCTISLQAQNNYGFRIAYENYGFAIGGTDEVFSGFKLDLIDNSSYQVRGINLCGAYMSKASRNNANNIIWGTNIGLVAARGRTFGVSLFPFGNFQDEVRGLSFGMLNSGYLRSGISLSIAWTKSFDRGIYGATGSLGVIMSKSIKGFAIAPVIAGLFQDYKYYRMEMRGCAISLLLYSNYMDGVSLSLVNINQLAHGLNIGAVNLSKKMTGIQIGLFNASDSTVANYQYVDPENVYKISRKKRPLAQVGIVNTSEQMFTTQFGIINYAENNYCVQFGLLNVNMANKKGLRVLPLVNWHIGTHNLKEERKKIQEENKRAKAQEKEIRKQIKERSKNRKQIEKQLRKDIPS